MLLNDFKFYQETDDEYMTFVAGNHPPITKRYIILCPACDQPKLKSNDGKAVCANCGEEVIGDFFRVKEIHGLSRT